MSRKVPWVPLLRRPGDLPLRETGELRTAGPVLLAALQLLGEAMAWAAETARQQRGVLLDLLELAVLPFSRLLLERRPELQMGAATHPVPNLALAIPVVRAIPRNALQVEDVDEVPRLIRICLYLNINVTFS